MPDRIYSVLAIDDDPTLLRAISRMLRTGFKVAGASSVEDALTLLAQAADSNRFDVILLDLNMPTIDGFQAISMIRNIEGYHGVPILVLSGSTSEQSQAQALSMGASDYIQKPPHPEILRLRVRLHAENADLRTQLESLAFTDTLTSLLNRRGLEQESERELKRCARDGTPVTVILLDIDHFKSVNDNYGHAVGDYALCRVAEVLARFFNRATDFVARLGGEEFVVFTSNQTQRDMESRLQECRDAIKEQPLHDGARAIDRHLSISAGALTVMPNRDSSTDIEKFIKRADICLYRAKESRDAQVWETIDK